MSTDSSVNLYNLFWLIPTLLGLAGGAFMRRTWQRHRLRRTIQRECPLTRELDATSRLQLQARLQQQSGGAPLPEGCTAPPPSAM